jgi:hypothetical protein
MATERGGVCVIILGKKLNSCLAFFLEQPKNLNHHLCRMVIEIFWLPQRGPTKLFQMPILVATKNFKSTHGGNQNGTRCGNQKISIANHPTITIFLDDDQFFSITTKGGCHMFLESFCQMILKNMRHAPFSSN